MARERLDSPVLGSDPLARKIYDLVSLQNGDLGSPVKYTAYAGTSYNFDVDSLDTTVGAVARFKSGGATMLDVTKDGISVTAVTTGALTANGNTILGDAAADTLVVNAASTFKASVTIQNSAGAVLGLFTTTAGAQMAVLGAAATPGLAVDVANGRTLVGIAPASPATATNDKLQIGGGRTYLMPSSEVYALGLRYVSSGGTVYLGASNSATPDLIASNTAGGQILRAFNAGGLLVGSNTTLTGTQTLEVQSGGIRVTAGGVLVTAGGLTVTAGGLTVTAGGLTVSADGAAITGAVTATGVVQSAASTGTTAGGAQTLQLGTSGPHIYCGSGAPTIAAVQGSCYFRTDGSGTNNRMYINTNGSTTWTAVTTVA